MPTSKSSGHPSPLREAKLLSLAALVLVAACGLDKLTASSSSGTASLESFAISGDSIIIAGDSIQLTAAIPGVALNAGVRVEWTSEDGTIASVSPEGRVRGVSPGVTTINAAIISPSLSEPIVRTAPVRVRYNTLVIAPPESLSALTATWRLFAYGTKRDGTRHSFVDPVYTVTGADTAIIGFTTAAGSTPATTCTATATAPCNVYARKVGAATIRATLGPLAATAPIKVVQVPARIGLTTYGMTIGGIGSTATNAATVYDFQNQPIPGIPLTWSSLNPAVASVSSTGVITANAVGTTRIVVSGGGTGVGFDVRVVTTVPATRLFIHSYQTSIAAGTSPGLQVSVTDGDLNLSKDAGNRITLEVISGPAAGTTGPMAANAVNGTATFPTLRFRLTGAYVIRATSPGLNTTVTSTITVNPAPAARLAFTTQPLNGTQGTTLAPVRVSIIDSIGNIVTTAPATNVTMALVANPGGATLQGGGATATVNGTATFSSLQVNNLGANYTLGASAAGFPTVQSAPFSIIGPPTKVAFASQPATNSEAGVALPAFQVQVQDAGGNVVGNSTAAVTITLNNSCGQAGTLTGTLTVNAVGGVATFEAVRLRQSCSVYRLNAVSTGLTSAISSTFAVVAGAPRQLAMQTQPSSPTTAGFSNFFSFVVQDSLSNTNTTTNVSVTVALGNNPTSTTISGTLTKTSVNGFVTFNDVVITKAGSGYTFVGSSPGLSSATTTGVDVQPASANKLVFITSPPATVRNGVTIAPAPVVEVRDFFDNPIPGYSGSIVVALRRSDFGGTASTLSGTTSQPVSAGRATFANLAVNGVEANPLVLVAQVVGLNQGLSSTFTVVP